MIHTDGEIFFFNILSLLGSGLNYILPFIFIGFLIWYIPWLIKQAIIDAIKETNSGYNSNSYKLEKIIDLLESIKINLDESKYSEPEKLFYFDQINWWDPKKTTFATRVLDELKEIKMTIKER